MPSNDQCRRATAGCRQLILLSPLAPGPVGPVNNRSRRACGLRQDMQLPNNTQHGWGIGQLQYHYNISQPSVTSLTAWVKVHHQYPSTISGGAQTRQQDGTLGSPWRYTCSKRRKGDVGSLVALPDHSLTDCECSSQISTDASQWANNFLPQAGAAVSNVAGDAKKHAEQVRTFAFEVADSLTGTPANQSSL